METESRLQVLSYSAEELKRKLPGRECALDSSISLLDEINRYHHYSLHYFLVLSL